MPSIAGKHVYAWHFVCCDFLPRTVADGFCWDGVLTPETCCGSAPPLPEVLPASSQLDRLRTSLGFTEAEFALFLAGLPGNPPHDTGRGRDGIFESFPCWSADGCAKEGFLRLHRSLLSAGMLPVRPLWMPSSEDPLYPIVVVDTSRNDGLRVPRHHELVIERVQIDAFITTVDDRLRGGRCLTWDDAASLARMGPRCEQVDVVHFLHGGGEHRVSEHSHGLDYYTDMHDSNLPSGTADLIFCLLVFEHLRKPWRVMAELFRIMAPGGQVVWAAPFAQPVHVEAGEWSDYWRFTPHGARVLAEEVGFEVSEFKSPGGAGLLSGALMGQNSMYWTRAEMFHESAEWPLLVLMLLEKPA